jgi:hypothetical protein
MLLLAGLLGWVAPAGAGTVLNVDTLAVNGFEVRTLSCDLPSAGFLASIGIVTALAGQKSALDACAPEGQAFRVSWTWAGGVTTATAILGSSSPARDACVADVLKQVAPSQDGTCSAVLLAGEAAAAGAAADKLAAP